MGYLDRLLEDPRLQIQICILLTIATLDKNYTWVLG